MRDTIQDDLLQALREVRRAMQSFAMSANHHVGGSLSCVDMLTSLFFGPGARFPSGAEGLADPDSDRLIFSKGHTASPLYFAHWLKGYLGDASLDDLLQFGEPGFRFERIPWRHPEWGFELTTGSLGQGLSFAIGMAIEARATGRGRHLWVLFGDAECGEGQVWEAAQATVELGLQNVTVLIDANGFGSMRSTDPGRLEETWRGFGWNAQPLDGHDHAALVNAIREARASSEPHALICRTTKGCGLLPPYPGTNKAGGEVAPEFRPSYDLESDVERSVAAARRLQQPVSNTRVVRPADEVVQVDWDADRHPVGTELNPKQFALELAERVESTPGLFVMSPDAIRNSGLGPTLDKFEKWSWTNSQSPVAEWRIAEQDALSAAAGLTAAGRHVALFLMEGFVWRMLDQIRQSVCASNLPVTIVGTSGGISDELGPMVQSDTCLSALLALLNLEVVEAADVNDAKAMLNWGLALGRPVYIRVPGDTLEVRHSYEEAVRLDWNAGCRVESDFAGPNGARRLTLVSAGAMVARAAAASDALRASGVDVRVVNLFSPTAFGRLSSEERAAFIDPAVPAVSMHNAPPSVLGGFLPSSLPTASLGVKGFGQWGKPLERLYELEGLTVQDLFSTCSAVLEA